MTTYRQWYLQVLILISFEIHMLSLLCYGIHWNKFHQSLLYHKFFSMKYVYIYIWIHISHFRWMVLIANILCFIIMFFSLPLSRILSLTISNVTHRDPSPSPSLYISISISIPLSLYLRVHMKTPMHTGFHSYLLFLPLALSLKSLPLQTCTILSEPTWVDPTPCGSGT